MDELDRGILDRNGYAPSIIQSDTTFCYACGRATGKLDRHEAFFGSLRQKSKAYGLWVLLCHYPCHMGTDGYQYNAERARELKARAQQCAMDTYGWTTEEFVSLFGKNYL